MARTPGILGACCGSPAELEAVLARLAPERRQAVVRIGATSCISAPFMAGERVGSAFAPHAPVVAFLGHLIGGIAGIDADPRRPAELVRRAYERWGSGCLARLEGNFAVAIFDPALPGFVAARDAAGTKPIFHSCPGACIVGSSAREVLRACGSPAVANPVALLRYLALGSVAGDAATLFQGIDALPGGHFLEAIAGRPAKLRPFASDGAADESPAPAPRSFEQCSEELRELLMRTVAAQSSGTKAGLALSGGIDSSGIAAGLRRAAGGEAPLQAFCYAHGHPSLPAEMDELRWARLAADRVGATLHPVRLESAGIPEAVARVTATQDFPFAGPAVLAQSEVFRAAADRGLDTMLGGHGPDYIFGGGNTHIFVRGGQLLREGRMRAALSYVRGAASYAALPPQRLLLYSLRAALPIAPARGGMPKSPPWTRASWFRERAAPHEREAPEAPSDPLRRLIFEQVHRFPLPSGLQWEECNALANGLDNRHPYLVAPMLRWASALPHEYLVSDQGETRRILRSALRGLVPDPILDRRHPVGFAVPVVAWLLESRPWVNERLRELESLPFFRPVPPAETWARIERGGASAWSTAYRAWRWIALLEWARHANVEFS
jgi:asparagine synthase (glutamine-hydrolysing)